MKITVSKSLRYALLACYSTALPVITVGTATLCATLPNYAQANNAQVSASSTALFTDVPSALTVTEELEGTIIIDGVVDGSLADSTAIVADGVIFTNGDNLTFSGANSSLTLGGNVTAGVVTVNGTDATIFGSANTFAVTTLDVTAGSFKLDGASAFTGDIKANAAVTLDFTDVASLKGDISSSNGATFNFNTTTDTVTALTGDINATAGITTVSGTLNFDALNLSSGATFKVAANSTIISTGIAAENDGVINAFIRTNTTTEVGVGATFTETSAHLLYGGGTSTIKGGGTYTVYGIKLSAHNAASTLTIDADTTMIISGEEMDFRGGSFMVSNWNQKNTINISGTLISNAGISNRDGTATINIKNGGTLELKQGGLYQDKDNSQDAVINVEDGATIAFGNQTFKTIETVDGKEVETVTVNDTDYGTKSGAQLIINMKGGSTFAASGEGTVTVYHTLVTTANSTLNFMANAGQTLIMTKTLGEITANIKGGGIVELQNTNSLLGLTIENGATANITSTADHVNSLTGVVIAEGGNLSLSGSILLAGAITNNGNITFADDVVLNLSNLTAVDKVYTLFNGSGTFDFGDLTVADLIGISTDNKTFTINHDNGTISYVLNVNDHVITDGANVIFKEGLMINGETFINKDYLTFNTKNATVAIEDAGFVIGEITVNGVEVSFSGDQRIDATTIIVQNGGTFILVDDVLKDGNRIMAAGTGIAKFVAAGTIGANSYLADFIGAVTIESGSFTTANHATGFESLTVNAAASFIYGGAQNTDYLITLKGAATTDGIGASITFNGGTHRGDINITGSGNTITVTNPLTFKAFTGSGDFTLQSSSGTRHNVFITGDSTNEGVLTLVYTSLQFKSNGGVIPTLKFKEIILGAGSEFAIIHGGDTATTKYLENTDFTFAGGGIWYDSGAAGATFQMKKFDIQANAKFTYALGTNVNITELTGIANFEIWSKTSAAASFNIAEVKDYNGTLNITGSKTNFSLTINKITQSEGKEFFVIGNTVTSDELVKSGAGSATLQSLTIAAGGSVTNALVSDTNEAGNLTITTLIATTGNIFANGGTTTITNLGTSTMDATVKTDATLNVGTGTLDSLVGGGNFNASGDIVINSTSSSTSSFTGNIVAEGTVTLTGTDNTANSISASNIQAEGKNITVNAVTVTGTITASAVTITGNDATRITSTVANLDTTTLTLGATVNLDVTSVLTVTTINIIGGSVVTSANNTAVSGSTALITAGSIAGGANSTLTLTLTAQAIGEMVFVDNVFTLIDLDIAYEGSFLLDLDQLVEALANGTDNVIDADGIVFNVGNTEYTISSVINTDDGSQKIIITEGETIPEPSTATLSLLALAGLLARRRRKQA